MRLRCVQAVVLALCAGAMAMAAADVRAEQPFYKGKRLTILINFAAGGSTDTEARLFVKHLAKHIDGRPTVIIQNMDGAGGLVGAKYVGEVAPRDGTVAGYFTATAFIYALDPQRFRVDFRTYEFVGIQPGTTVHFVRTDVAPGMKQATDIINAKGVIVGSLAPDSPKGIHERLALDMLGVPYKFISGYRSGAAAKLALQQREINLFGESPPSYVGVIEPSLVKTGEAIPLFYDPGYDGTKLFVPDAAKDLAIDSFPDLYQRIKGNPPSGRLWDVYKNMLGADSTMQRLIVLPPSTPLAAVTALRAAVKRTNEDKDFADEARRVFGFVPVWRAEADNDEVARGAMSMNPQLRTFLVDYIKHPPK